MLLIGGFFERNLNSIITGIKDDTGCDCVISGNACMVNLPYQGISFQVEISAGSN
jgi:hypothetical protein